MIEQASGEIINMTLVPALQGGIRVPKHVAGRFDVGGWVAR